MWEIRETAGRVFQITNVLLIKKYLHDEGCVPFEPPPRPPERILAVLPKPCVIVDYVLIKNTPSSYVCPPSTNSPDLSRISN